MAVARSDPRKKKGGIGLPGPLIYARVSAQVQDYPRTGVRLRRKVGAKMTWRSIDRRLRPGARHNRRTPGLAPLRHNGVPRGAGCRTAGVAKAAALSLLALSNHQAERDVEFSRPDAHDVPMTWQEYQESVARLYEQMEGVGTVKRNVFLPDKVTGTRRQVDVLLEVEAKGHLLTVVIDAKFRNEPLDVKDIEEVASLAKAVKASKAVIVAPNGWNQSAAKKAAALALDLRLMTLEKALELLVEGMWQVCEHCGEDCVVLDQEGVTPYQGGWLGGLRANAGTARRHWSGVRDAEKRPKSAWGSASPAVAAMPGGQSLMESISALPPASRTRLGTDAFGSFDDHHPGRRLKVVRDDDAAILQPRSHFNTLSGTPFGIVWNGFESDRRNLPIWVPNLAFYGGDGQPSASLKVQRHSRRPTRPGLSTVCNMPSRL